MRVCAILTALFVASLTLTAQDKDKDKDKPAIKEISTKDLKLAFPRGGKATEPKEIKTAEELAKNEVIGGEAKAIQKHLDFEKQKLVVFAWGGSGQDKLAGELKTADKKTTAVFTYTRGLTRDFRQHIHLFAVPKDAEVKVSDGK
jgi:hypothetical protein